MAKPSTARRKSRFWLFLPFILLILVVVLYSVFWFVMRGELSKGIDEWIATERANGSTIEYSDKRIVGYPFRFALHVDDPVYGQSGQAKWQGEELQLIMQPWNWQHVIARFPGQNVITEANGTRHSANVGSKSAASLSWDKEGIRRFGLQLDEAAALIAGDDVTAKGFSLNLAPTPGSPDDLRIALQWDELVLPAPVPDVDYLGDTLQPSRMIAEIEGFYPALAAAGGKVEDVPRELLRTGGAVHLGQLLLNWGPLKFGAMADLEAEAGVVSGTLSLRADEIDTLRAALEDAGKLNDATILTLGMLEKSSEEGGFLTLTVKDNGIYFLGNRLGDFPVAGL